MKSRLFPVVIVSVLFLIVLQPAAALSACGNGIIEGGEECDPGSALFEDGDPSLPSCTTGGDCFFESSCCKFNCQFVGQGASCFDGNLCTQNDICDQVGTCGGDPTAAGLACDDSQFCTITDTCDGAGGCTGTGDPCAGGSVCEGACDEALDSCFVPTGTPCGSSTDSDCTDPDTCDGLGGCVVNDAAAGSPAPTECDDTNACTSDQCDGAGGCRYANEAPGSACGDASTTSCSSPDSCDGAGACLSNDLVAGAACGDPTDTDCTDPDSCDGAGACDANDETAGVAAPNQCDELNECTADQCDGSGGCQNPALAAGSACGDGTTTECTAADTCDGAGSCTDNDHAAGTPAPGLCDDQNDCTADQCDGGGQCQNPPEAGGTACGDPADTECTNADSCDGAGACSSNDEPAGVSAPALCDDTNVCTTDECDGAGSCQNPGVAFGAACGDSTDDQCLNPDVCDGAGTCIANDESDGTPCDDGELCSIVDECALGVCTAVQFLDCGDTDGCTHDFCDSGTGSCLNVVEPDPDCDPAGAAQLVLIDRPNDAKDRLKWKWGRGSVTPIEDFGAPATQTDYELCVYDSAADVQSLSMRLFLPASPTWQLKGSSKLQYKDKSGSADGIQVVKLKSGGKPAVGLKAKGQNLPTPAPFSADEFFALDPILTAQIASSDGRCWVTDFLEAKRNTTSRFKTRQVGIVIR